MTISLQGRGSALSLAGLALLVVSGCQTTKDSKLVSWWKKDPKPEFKVPDQNEEVVRYYGQKKKEPKPFELPPELKEKLASRNREADAARSYNEHLRKGGQFLTENRLDEARREYEQALDGRPDDPDVHHRLAVVADKQRMWGAADDHYRAALRIQPRNPNLLSDYGYSLSLRGNMHKAEMTLNEALDVDPSHRGAMANLGDLYSKQGRYDDALAMLRRGATEAEVRQHIAQLFPQGPQRGGDRSRMDLVAHEEPDDGDSLSDPRNVSQMSNEELQRELDRRTRTAMSGQGEGERNDLRPGRTRLRSGRDSGIARSVYESNDGDSTNRVPLRGVDLQPSMRQNDSMMAAQGTNPKDHLEFLPGSEFTQSDGPRTNRNGTPSGVQPAAGVQYPGDAQQSEGTIPIYRGRNPYDMSGMLPPNGGNPAGMGYGMDQDAYRPSASNPASVMAARLGMSAGPGALFPPLAVEPASSAEMPENNFNGDFRGGPSAGSQNLNGGPNQNGNPNQYSNPNGGPAGWNSSHRSNIGPASPTDNWAPPMDRPMNWEQGPGAFSDVPREGSRAVQPGGQRPNDPVDSFRSEMNPAGGGRPSSSVWGEPTSFRGNQAPGGTWQTNGNGLPNISPQGTHEAARPSNRGANTGSAESSIETGSVPQWPHSQTRF